MNQRTASRHLSALRVATRPVIEQLEDRRLLSSIAGPTTAASGTPITLQLNSSGIADPTAVNINWGDGYTSAPAVGATSATHTYDAPGRYTPSATITDATNAVHPLTFGLDPTFANNGTRVENGLGPPILRSPRHHAPAPA